MARYEGAPIIPVEKVRQDYFGHLTAPKFMTKLRGGDIGLPVIQLEKSQKAHKYVDIRDLATFLDVQRDEGKRAYEVVHG